MYRGTPTVVTAHACLLRGADYMNFDMGKIYMMITVAIVPIIIVYLLLSKYIIAGITLGGVKE